MSGVVATWIVPAAAAVVVLLAGCVRLPLGEPATPSERFANAYVELLPVGALMQHAATQDPRWPLGDKAALVSQAQLGCMRQAMSPGDIEAAQRELAHDYAKAHPDALADELAVLERGAARLIGQAMREGGQLPAPQPARAATTEESRALIAFATEARYAGLRQATGLERLAGGEPAPTTQRGQDIGRAITVKFLTDAFLRCHIPVKLLY